MPSDAVYNIRESTVKDNLAYPGKIIASARSVMELDASVLKCNRVYIFEEETPGKDDVKVCAVLISPLEGERRETILKGVKEAFDKAKS